MLEDDFFYYYPLNRLYKGLRRSLYFENLDNLDTYIQNKSDFTAVIMVPFECLNMCEGAYNVSKNSWIKQDKISLSIFDNFVDFYPQDLPLKPIEILSYQSNFTDDEFKNAVEQIRQDIFNGEYFQTNLTRKFFGYLKPQDEYLSFFFYYLNRYKPPYASFLNLQNLKVLCFSPELFLKYKDGKLISSPIKGTIKADASEIELDNFVKDTKNRAENTMIVDLTRNDFSKICKVGTVNVLNLCRLAKLGTVNHLISDVVGEPEKTNLSDILKAVFPPPSMTGAPKIAATQAAIDLENMQRGLYSGCLGVVSKINGKLEFDLSVVIRTIIIQDNKFEFQSGCGITYLSNPQDELDEMYKKIQFFKSGLNLKIP